MRLPTVIAGQTHQFSLSADGSVSGNVIRGDSRFNAVSPLRVSIGQTVPGFVYQLTLTVATPNISVQNWSTSVSEGHAQICKTSGSSIWIYFPMGSDSTFEIGADISIDSGFDFQNSPDIFLSLEDTSLSTNDCIDFNS
ncbi:MAG: hypothetical protein HWE20_14900 [Gammaproteobacteria bacterium]|nr:hypothetical protein [Gammaproteobacteria bacterium]